MKNLASSLVAFVLFLHSMNVVAQKAIVASGVVVDSASQQPLPFVAIQVKGEPSGRSANDDGSFSIPCSPHDTLIFSRLGYYPALLIVETSDKSFTIELIENARMLKDIVVYDRIIVPGVEEWKKTQQPNKPLKFQNGAQVAGQGILPTFGPGITIGFGGKDKTKKKRDELAKTETYRTTINSLEVKKQLMELYSVSEETYNRKLQAFNKENPDVAYLTSHDEIISMLIQFFALKER